MSIKEYNIEIADRVKECLEKEDIHFLFEEDDGLFRFHVQLDTMKILYHIKIYKDEILIYTYAGYKADESDEEMNAKISEFILKTNYGLRNGCFEYDHRDGDIRYKVYINCDHCLPSTESIMNGIYYSAIMQECYFKEFICIIYGLADCQYEIKN